MKIWLKDVTPLGFKGSGMFADSKWHHHYYAAVEATKKVFIIDALEHSVSHFDLTKEQWKDFQKGNLKLVPKGCCNPTGGKELEDPIMDIQGDFTEIFENKPQFIAYLKRLMEKR